MQRKLKVGIDLMGSENAPQDLLKALQGLSLPEDVELVAIGTSEFEPIAKPCQYVIATDFISMEEHPLHSLRKKKNASILVGLRLLKEKKIDAFITLGNTGALVTGAKIILSKCKGVLRPALLTLMPTKKNPVVVLDVGANLQAKAIHLTQFAQIGVAFQKTRGIKNPTVGLLNIGSEPLKGTSEHRLAYNQIQGMNQLNFVGNIEGTTVFNGDVDVIVTDGFTGNVFLKTAEGIASLILDKITPEPQELKKFQSLHYTEYPGALLAGIKGIVIKCHGYAVPKSVTNAVIGAIELAKQQFVQKISNELV